ncbi:MAG: hypothetical protein IK130_06750 [Oscillospiraceae bacterium]|nr:hypothetical protein [Oscillospiraceae bacterium]
MEILVEVIGELISGLLEWILNNERIPKVVRIVLICMLLLIPVVPLVALVILIDSIGAKIVFALLAALFIYLGVRKICRILRS